jgi:hypothetical protein
MAGTIISGLIYMEMDQLWDKNYIIMGNMLS